MLIQIFRKNYFLISLLLFIVEILIALFVQDQVIRPFGGDFLAVILLYSFVRSLTHFSIQQVAIGALMLSFMMEMFQYFEIVRIMRLENIRWARIIIGTSFSWLDMLAYTLGIVFVLLVENRLKPHWK